MFEGCAAPHPPAGTFSPYSDGEKGCAPTPVIPSPRFSRGEGTGEGQRRPNISGRNNSVRNHHFRRRRRQGQRRAQGRPRA
ncbi:hypothetical protein FJ937_14055 [Mesorhizobium sp. B2-4-4]|nr:hypothetical protein FJ937_14055 [Mesorhizobium sp. B2-4-4]